jgi:hypothetical protein
MEMQQMLERILAGQAEMKADQNLIKREIMAGQAKAEEMMADENAKQNQMAEEILEMLEANQAKMDAWLTEMKNWRRELMACQEMTEACQNSKEPSPEEMESEVERREFPTKEAAVKSSRTMKKRHKGRRMAAGRRGKPKELTRRDCGSRGLLAAACRKVSRRATVAWRKRYVFRKIRTQGSCGPRQELAAARRVMTLRSKVARQKVKVVRKDRTKDSVAPGTQKGCTCRMKR